jgi:tetratricopeptide (TPR) repeat protein
MAIKNMEPELRSKIEDLYSKQEFYKAIHYCNKDVCKSVGIEKRIAYYLRYHCYKNVSDYSNALEDLNVVIGKDTNIIELYLERLYLLLELSMQKHIEKDINTILIKIKDDKVKKCYIQLDLMEKIIKDVLIIDKQTYSNLSKVANMLSQVLIV